MRALIVDDHLLFGEGLKLLLGSAAAIEDITCCTSGAEALGLASTSSYDLVLLDWKLGSEPSGVELIVALKQLLPSASVVVVSGENAPRLIKLAIDSGASGFVPKESSSSLLIDALRVVAHGGVYLPSSVLALGSPEQVAQWLPEQGTSSNMSLRSMATVFPALTPRQSEILNLLIRGMSNKLIARQLDISDGTVKQHLNAIFRELDVHSRTEAVYLMAMKGVALPQWPLPATA